MKLSHSLIVCLGLGVGMSFLGTPEAQQERAETEVSVGLEEAVRNFLSASVDPDADGGLSFFGQNAIANRVMLDEPCLDYISDDERQSEAARRVGIRKFLDEFSQQKLAGAQFPSELALTLQQRVTNDFREDRFLLVEASLDELLDEVGNGAYLRELLPPDGTVSLLPLESGSVILLIWALESGEWKVAHVSIPCV